MLPFERSIINKYQLSFNKPLNKQRLVPTKKEYKMNPSLLLVYKKLRSSLRHSGPINNPNSLHILFSNHILCMHTPSILSTPFYLPLSLPKQPKFLVSLHCCRVATVSLSFLHHSPTLLSTKQIIFHP